MWAWLGLKTDIKKNNQNIQIELYFMDVFQFLMESFSVPADLLCLFNCHTSHASHYSFFEQFFISKWEFCPVKATKHRQKLSPCH